MPITLSFVYYHFKGFKKGEIVVIDKEGKREFKLQTGISYSPESVLMRTEKIEHLLMTEMLTKEEYDTFVALLNNLDIQ